MTPTLQPIAPKSINSQGLLPTRTGLYTQKTDRKAAVQTPNFDGDYVARLSSGDPDVERHFVAYFGDLLAIKLRSRVRSHQAVDDLRQEVFLRVFRALRTGPGLEHPERLGAYVHSVCNNVIFEFFRSDSKHPSAPENPVEQQDERVSIEWTLVQREREDAVRSVLQELPEKDRAILSQVFLEEVDKATVCERFGVNLGYLRVLVHRAKNRFRVALEKRAAASGLA